MLSSLARLCVMLNSLVYVEILFVNYRNKGSMQSLGILNGTMTFVKCISIVRINCMPEDSMLYYGIRKVMVLWWIF